MNWAWIFQDAFVAIAILAMIVTWVLLARKKDTK